LLAFSVIPDEPTTKVGGERGFLKRLSRFSRDHRSAHPGYTPGRERSETYFQELTTPLARAAFRLGLVLEGLFLLMVGRLFGSTFFFSHFLSFNGSR